MIDLSADQAFWLVLCGFIIAFILAFGIGANDVANSFGTSVGSKVLTLKQACILATIFEILGSILIGAKVSGTIRKGILNPKSFDGQELELMLGYVSALVGCCIWLILATILNLPVSGTHSIVGATIGMAIVSKGISVIQWMEILKIVSSWLISPLLSGVVSLLIFLLIRRFILRAKNPLEAGLKFLPLIYTITISVNFGGILESSPPLLGFDKIPGWGKWLMVGGLAVIIYLTVWLIIVPYMKKKVEKTIAHNKQSEEALGNRDHQLYLEYNDSGSNGSKKSMGTQVDYVTLIIARHNEDVGNMDKYEEKADTLTGKQIMPINQQTLTSFHSDILNKKKRTRLDSAPSAYKDLPDIDDVNLTLGGYLHTIHSPAYRQQLTLRSQNLKLRHQTSVPSNQASVQSGGIPLFSKIFTQNNLPNSAQAKEGELGDDGQMPLLTSENNAAANSMASEKKYGRFTSVPAKIDMKNVAEKSNSKTPIPELEAEIDELDLLPEKKEKKVEIDDFAHADPPEAAKLFSFLQVLTAIFGSFAHGGNDVSNAIGPLIGLFLIYRDNEISVKADAPEWILFFGGVGISVGLWVLGRRVIKTIGEDLTKITASSGFVIEIASAMTVLGASLMNIPVSTTHCKVGSVVFTGRVRSKQSVDWSLFRNIIIAWIVTVPVTGSIAAGCQVVLKVAFGLKL